MTSLSVPVRPMPQLSDRASAGQSSAIRDLLDQASRPGMISLAGGLPDAARFPTEQLAAIAHRIITEDGRSVLQYGVTQGDESARVALASLFGDATDPAQVVVTTGSQQALDLIARVVVNPGDQVVVGDPDYLGALQVFRAYSASLCPVPIDVDGLDTSHLESRLASGWRPKLCYIVPNFHNPSGVSMSRERRHHLNALSNEYGFLVVEDDPYRELAYEADPPVNVMGDPALTVRLRSTSKMLAPGLRIGALAGPRWLTDAIVTAKQSVDLHTSSLNQALVAEALAAPWLRGHVDDLRALYRGKRDRLVFALRDRFDDAVEFTVPAGGMFLWVRFLEIEDTARWLERCLDQGVCFVPGQAFSVERDLSSHARLSFATGSGADLARAVDRMAAATG